MRMKYNSLKYLLIWDKTTHLLNKKSFLPDAYFFIAHLQPVAIFTVSYPSKAYVMYIQLTKALITPTCLQL